MTTTKAPKNGTEREHARQELETIARLLQNMSKAIDEAIAILVESGTEVAR